MNWKYSLKSLVLFSFFVTFLWMGSMVYAADISLAWDPNNETTINGYKLYFGTSSQNYSESVDVGNITEYTLENMNQDETYYFAVTAYDTAGNESGFSNEISYYVSINQHFPPSSTNQHVPPNPIPWLEVLLLSDSISPD